MAREASVRFAAGTRIGDYRVEQEVAIEETCVVYLATHVVLPRQAHVKVTHPGSRNAAIQVLREACILEALSHTGIPRVHECGVLADRRPWSAVERMQGVTLKQLAGDAPLAVSDLVVMLRDVADILHHAHERGVVHRRLTASAILLTQRRRNLHAIGAWGDARTLDTESEVVVDPRDDVRALGEIAFRGLTGKSPYQPAPSLGAARRSPYDAAGHSSGHMPAVPTSALATSASAHSPSAPGELVALIDQMLAEPVLRPLAGEVFDRALWLCETLEASPMFDRPRWTPPQGFVSEGVSRADTDSDASGFAIRITRTRTI